MNIHDSDVFGRKVALCLAATGCSQRMVAAAYSDELEKIAYVPLSAVGKRLQSGVTRRLSTAGKRVEIPVTNSKSPGAKGQWDPVDVAAYKATPRSTTGAAPAPKTTANPTPQASTSGPTPQPSFLDKLKGQWEGLSPNKRLAMSAAGVGTAGAGGLGVGYALGNSRGQRRQKVVYT